MAYRIIERIDPYHESHFITRFSASALLLIEFKSHIIFQVRKRL